MQVEYPASPQPRPLQRPALSPTLADDAVRIAWLEAEVQALREETSRLRQVADSATDYAVITLDPDGCVTGWNAGARSIMGFTEAEMLGRYGAFVFTPEDRAEGAFGREMCHAIEYGSAANERWHVRRDGSRFWASGTMMPLLGADGGPHGFLNIFRDGSAARAEAEQRELALAEMGHRIKNTLAIVQAVATQTARCAPAPSSFLAAFGSRLLVLAQSHDLLVRGNWTSALLRDVLHGALGTYAGEPGRVRIDGMAVVLRAELVMSASLTFHELATNAAKHGALSVPGGHVKVCWTVTPASAGGRRVEVLWRERGGPAVRPPERRGFGLQLLSRGTPSGVIVEMLFQPEGLECHITLPLGPGAERQG